MLARRILDAVGDGELELQVIYFSRNCLLVDGDQLGHFAGEEIVRGLLQEGQGLLSQTLAKGFDFNFIAITRLSKKLE